MKKLLLFLFFINCFVSCSKTDVSLNLSNNTQEISNQSGSSNAVNFTPTPAKKTTPKTKISTPKVSDFAVETFFRHSKKKDEKMNMLPPFQYGEISFFVASNKIKSGDSVTAISLQIDYENITLKVKKIERVPFLDCDVEKTGSDVEFEKVADRRLLEIKPISGRAEEQPFDFLVIYPTVENAKKLKQTELIKEMLPEKVGVEQVVAAIDLNDDGNPDLLVSNYCCYDSSQCDCTERYQKTNAEWKYLGGSEPC